VPNAINEAAPLLEKKGALAYQIKDLVARKGDEWSHEDETRFSNLQTEYRDVESKLEAIHETRDADREKREGRELVADLIGTSPDEQAQTYRDWADHALREYLAFGQVRSERGRAAIERTGKMLRASAAKSLDPELRDQNIGTPGDGGYLTHPEFANELTRQMQAYIGVSQVARIITTATGSTMYWPATGVDKGEKIAEAAAQTADTGADIAFTQKQLDAYKYSSKVVRVSRELLMDSLLPIESIVMDRLAERIGRIIEQEATTGDGTGDPNGFVTAAPVGHEVATADAPGGNATVPTKSDLIDLLHSVDAAYRGDGCAWLAHDSIWGYVRKLDDSTNNLLWQPSLQLGQPDRMMGYPVIAANEMLEADDVDANNEKFMVFGNFRYFVMRFVRGIHMQRLNELYAANDQIGFFAVQRFDCELIHGGAAGTAPIKALSTTVA
jgi:HK97 family phage major capsid protein